MHHTTQQIASHQTGVTNQNN